ncbi:PHD-zinc-finger like domain-containing protein [Haematococcus lacustris]
MKRRRCPSFLPLPLPSTPLFPPPPPLPLAPSCLLPTSFVFPLAISKIYIAQNKTLLPTWLQVRWAGDRCCVCDSDVDYDCDQLVSCDGCGITVHQSCYGIVDLPGHDDMWLCRACEHKEKTGSVAQCCLCPIAGGALKPTNLEGGQWCHAACMQWIPEVTCADPSRMEPIIRIEHIQKERWELVCCCCKQRMGAKIQCSQCYAAYHPLCARMAGLAMEMADVGNGGQLQIVSYCPRHCKPQPELSGQPRTDLRGGGGGGPGGRGGRAGRGRVGGGHEQGAGAGAGHSNHSSKPRPGPEPERGEGGNEPGGGGRPSRYRGGGGEGGHVAVCVTRGDDHEDLT